MDDYISREAAIAQCKRHSDYTAWSIEDGIEAIPAADVEPVRYGRWEQCFEDWRQQIEGDKCSACGFEYYGTGISRFHYCPNCGAKMDLEGKSNEQ